MPFDYQGLRVTILSLALGVLPAVAGEPLSETEPNDGFAGAMVLPPTSLPAVAVEGFLGPDATSAGVDYFSFPVTSTTTMVTASIFDQTPRLYDNDTALGIFHPAGYLTYVNDDGNPGLLSSIHFFPTEAGNWAVAFSGLTDPFFTGQGHSLAFDYRVVVTTGPSAREAEPNDSLGAAQALPMSLLPTGAVAIEGTLGPDGTAAGVDYYSLQVQAGTLVTASLFDFTPEITADHVSLLGIYGPDGSLLTMDEDSGPGLLSALHFFAPETGTYTLAVTGFGDSDFDGLGHSQAFDYRLVVSVPEPNALAVLAAVSLLGLARRRRS